MCNNNRNIEIDYEFDNMVYNINGTQELHTRLQNDSVFFEDYISKKGGALDMKVENISQDDTLDLDETWTWTKKSILIFLDCIEKKKLDLHNPKIKKKVLWKEIKNMMISKGFTNIDEFTVERKLRNMKGTYKTIRDNKRKTLIDRGDIKWEYFEAMHRIFQDDKTINIGHTIASSTKSLPSATSIQTTPKSGNVLKAKKQKERGKLLYGLRKKQIKVEESRVKELTLLRKAVEENNRIQSERNKLLKLFLEKQK